MPNVTRFRLTRSDEGEFVPMTGLRDWLGIRDLGLGDATNGQYEPTSVCGGRQRPVSGGVAGTTQSLLAPVRQIRLTRAVRQIPAALHSYQHLSSVLTRRRRRTYDT